MLAIQDRFLKEEIASESVATVQEPAPRSKCLRPKAQAKLSPPEGYRRQFQSETWAVMGGEGSHVAICVVRSPGMQRCHFINNPTLAFISSLIFMWQEKNLSEVTHLWKLQVWGQCSKLSGDHASVPASGQGWAAHGGDSAGVLC
jgi:hypothetical protein